MNDLVSVIIPVYNSERYLEECLRSVCGQTYQNLEIVAVNDGSTDSSLKILENWRKKDSRIKIITRENGGQSAARNTGIKTCRGNVVTFVDSDDLLWEKGIESLLNVKSEFGVKIACGLMSMSPENLGRQINSKRPFSRTEDSSEITAGILYQTSDVVLGPWGQLFDRDLFTEDKLFWEGKYYEDLELIPKLYMSVSEIAILSRNVYFYRQHGGSFVHTFSPKRLDVLKAVASLIENIAPLSANLRRAVEDRTLSASFNVFVLTAGMPEYTVLNIKCWETIKVLRKNSLFDRRVRLKNKIGIIISFAGRLIMTKIGKFAREHN